MMLLLALFVGGALELPLLLHVCRGWTFGSSRTIFAGTLPLLYAGCWLTVAAVFALAARTRARARPDFAPALIVRQSACALLAGVALAALGFALWFSDYLLTRAVAVPLFMAAALVPAELAGILAWWVVRRRWRAGRLQNAELPPRIPGPFAVAAALLPLLAPLAAVLALSCAAQHPWWGRRVANEGLSGLLAVELMLLGLPALVLAAGALDRALGLGQGRLERACGFIALSVLAAAAVPELDLLLRWHRWVHEHLVLTSVAPPGTRAVLLPLASFARGGGLLMLAAAAATALLLRRGARLCAAPLALIGLGALALQVALTQALVPRFGPAAAPWCGLTGALLPLIGAAFPRAQEGSSARTRPRVA